MSESDHTPAALLRWAGSKRKLLPKLTPYWQPGFRRYVEPFVGSGALFYALRPDEAVLSDVNRELVSVYRTIRSRPRAVYDLFSSYPVTPAFYYKLRSVNPGTLRRRERAARFLFLNRFCFNGLYRTDRRGRFNVPFAPNKSGGVPTWEQFAASSRLLRNANLLNGDFEQILTDNVRGGDFVYLDPPYAVANRRIFRQYGPQTFGLDDLKRLGSVLREIDRRGAGFVVSYAYCAEARHLFRRWHCKTVFAQRNISGFAQHRRTAAELVVSNIG